MTMERYRELLEAVPALTKGDFSRLKEFRPRLLNMVRVVRWAFL